MNDYEREFHKCVAMICGFNEIRQFDWDRAKRAGCFDGCHNVGEYAEAFLKYQLWIVSELVAEDRAADDPAEL